jgi:hypothetical protein
MLLRSFCLQFQHPQEMQVNASDSEGVLLILHSQELNTHSDDNHGMLLVNGADGEEKIA